MITALFWDLDGTLLTTNRGGVAALEDACEVVLGTRLNLSNMSTAGMTDREIAAAIVREHRGHRDETEEAAFLDHYASQLPTRLEQRRGHVMPNVAEVLAACAERDDIVMALLTGNVERCAWAKLASYGIDRALFAGGGGFAEDGHARLDIGRAVVRRVGSFNKGFLIGDTPSDVAAGKALSLRTVAVATGGYTDQQLRATHPWTLLQKLPDAKTFLDLVEA